MPLNTRDGFDFMQIKINYTKNSKTFYHKSAA